MFEREFMKGLPIVINEHLTLHQHTLDEIEDAVGFMNYQMTVHSLLRYNYEFEFDMEDAGLKFNDYNNYDVFFMLMNSDEQNRRIFLTVFEFVFKTKFTIINVEGALRLSFLAECGAYMVLDMDMFVELRKVLTVMFFYSKPKRRIAKDKNARNLIQRDMKKRQNDACKYSIYSIMSSIVWSPNSSETYETIWNKTPYQIYEGFKTIEKINNFNYVLLGIHNGNIDSKKVEWNMINWIKEVQNVN
jgi:hypothetical protein